jgi:hypothetical protein
MRGKKPAETEIRGAVLILTEVQAPTSRSASGQLVRRCVWTVQDIAGPTGRSLDVRAFRQRVVDLAPVGEVIKCVPPILTESHAAAMAFDGRSTFDTPVQQVQRSASTHMTNYRGSCRSPALAALSRSTLFH